MRHSRVLGLITLLLAAGAVRVSLTDTSSFPAHPSPATPPHLAGTPVAASPLPLPHTLPLETFEGLLYGFLEERRYDDTLRWVKDKRVRDTGPYIAGTSYGTHPAVRAFYSPEVIAWLDSGRPGAIPDGAMIIKEMYAPPAARYDGIREAGLASISPRLASGLGL